LLDKQCTQSPDVIPSVNKTSTSCDNNNKDTNYHLHVDKKLKAGCVVVVPFASLTIDSQVKSKEQKERVISFIFWTTISDFTDTILMGLNSMYANLKIGLMTLRIHSNVTKTVRR
jgi:hypothetical protein